MRRGGYEKGRKKMADTQKIPYKIYLEEKEMPTQWYNVRADMKINRLRF